MFPVYLLELERCCSVIPYSRIYLFYYRTCFEAQIVWSVEILVLELEYRAITAQDIEESTHRLSAISSSPFGSWHIQ